MAAADVDRVVPAVAVDPVPGAPSVVLGIVNYHGTVVPVIDPRRRFGEHGGSLELRQKLILVRTPARLVALLTDGVEGVEALDTALVLGFAEFVPGAGKISGSAAHGDGLIYIYDANLLLTQAEDEALAAALEQGAQ